jgi:hypothetical protein
VAVSVALATAPASTAAAPLARGLRRAGFARRFFVAGFAVLGRVVAFAFEIIAVRRVVRVVVVVSVVGVFRAVVTRGFDRALEEGTIFGAGRGSVGGLARGVEPFAVSRGIRGLAPGISGLGAERGAVGAGHLVFDGFGEGFGVLGKAGGFVGRRLRAVFGRLVFVPVRGGT